MILAGEPLPPDVEEELASVPTERERSPSDVLDGDDRPDGAAADGTVGTPTTATAAAILDGSAGEPLPETSVTIGVLTVSIGCVDLRDFERFERGDSDEAPQETVLAFAAGEDAMRLEVLLPTDSLAGVVTGAVVLRLMRLLQGGAMAR